MRLFHEGAGLRFAMNKNGCDSYSDRSTNERPEGQTFDEDVCAADRPGKGRTDFSTSFLPGFLGEEGDTSAARPFTLRQ